MGWSREGADKIAHLRAYQANHGDMLDLVRMEKEDLSKAAGAINHSLPSKYSMLADFNPNIWGL